MNEYVGNPKERITVRATFVKESGFSGYYDYVHVYIFNDDNDNCLVWKTTSDLYIEKNGENSPIERGDYVELTGTVKEHVVYKGEKKQTNLNRCKVRYIGAKAIPESYKTKHDIWLENKDNLKTQQLLSIKAGDQILRGIPYRQYKEHYSDCETLIDSFSCDSCGRKCIDVIVRDGRLVNSGVRGKHYNSYEFMDNASNRAFYFKAVSEENARKQMKKALPDSFSNMTLVSVEEYANHDWYYM